MEGWRNGLVWSCQQSVSCRPGTVEAAVRRIKADRNVSVQLHQLVGNSNNM